jgi:peptide/nickel transport system substrate-binding protein/microcin C transport system substrate-binding protein
MRPYYDGIAKVEVVDRRTVRFTARDRYFRNFYSAAGLPVVPRHVYGDPKRGPKIHDTIVGSGPYLFERWEKGAYISLRKNPLWWGRKDPLYRGMYNPERVHFRFVGNEDIAVEMLKKGELDFMDLSGDAFVRKTSGHGWGTRVLKRKIRTSMPTSVSYVAWNLDRPIFRDRRVRLALAHLMDRRLMIEKFHYGLTSLATGPWYRQSEYADPGVKPVEYDPDRALRLLREAGWEDRDRNGILEKEIDGRVTELRFTVILGNKATERILTMFREDARRVGVEVNLQFLGLNVVTGLIDERKFDAVEAGWGGWLVEFDPRPAWHSSGAAKGGLNFMNYRSPEVDRLLDLAHQTPDKRRRVPLLRRAYRRIAEDAPALFLFNGDYVLYAHSERVGMPRAAFNYDTGIKYWWVKSP